MVLFTAEQTPVEQWYPERIQPSPVGRKVADTGDAVAVVEEPASELAAMS